MPLVALVVLLAAGAAWLVGTLGARAIHQSRSQAGADAAALSAAIDDGSVAAIAEANAVTIESVTRGDHVEVVVSSRAPGGRWISVAAAAAQFTRPQWRGLDPSLRRALARAEALLGEEIPIASGLRTRAEQQELWDNRATNPYPVAVPGTSRHELGLAVDIPSGFVPRLLTVSAAAGLCQPLPLSDPVHFVPCHVTPMP